MDNLPKTSPQSTSCLVKDFVQYKLSQKGHAWEELPQTPKLTPAMKALRRIGDEFEIKNRSAFDEMFANLSINPINAEETFLGVINELFSQGVTWGRLVAMFAFGGEMAIDCYEKGMFVILNPLIEWMTTYIDVHLINWIDDHGGWNSFIDFCQEGFIEEEEKFKPGFRKVAWGLAVGVIGALTVGAFLAK